MKSVILEIPVGFEYRQEDFRPFGERSVFDSPF
jgi:hypothetical protein